MRAGAEALEQDDRDLDPNAPGGSPDLRRRPSVPPAEAAEAEPESGETESAHAARLERLGGARAEFVSNLGRRVSELTAVLTELSFEPGSMRFREELRRKLHALAAGARLLRFPRLAAELADLERTLDDRPRKIDPGDLQVIRRALERAPQLAWLSPAESRSSTSPVKSEGVSLDLRELGAPASPTATSMARAPGVADTKAITAAAPLSPAALAELPTTALVVGGTALGKALASAAGTDLDIEHTTDLVGAIDMARALAPDVLVLDADADGILELCDALSADPLAEGIPIVIAGALERPQDAAPFVARGVARILAGPLSPDALRRACLQAVETFRPHTGPREPLGELNVDQLGARLAEELRRGLCDATSPTARTKQVDFGDGSAIFAALWGAVARVRDLVTIESRGGVRFQSGPEGALPLAWWSDRTGELRGDMRDARGQETKDDERLEGLSVLVADDDPAVTWFLSGLLRSRGAKVYEAHDGARALHLATAVMPDLVVSDILMPRLDGFSLCRALRRDVVLRGVPVVLLSWKEDLLSRVRELGADAAGYLRKEASSAVIEQRVRELLRPRRRIADRLRAGGEVRGRLDDVTTYMLLGLAAALRPASVLTVRDAVFLYEVELRAGRPVRASRSDGKGLFERGPTVLANLLGVGAGRFTLTDADPKVPVSAELSGSFEEQIAPLVASARAAQRLLTGPALLRAHRVTFEMSGLRPYLAASPEPARSALLRLQAGSSPTELVQHDVPVRLLEDAITDAAAHGLVKGVFDASLVDQLQAAAADELELLTTRGASAMRRLDVLPTFLGTYEPANLDPHDAESVVPSAVPASVAPPEAQSSIDSIEVLEVEPSAPILLAPKPVAPAPTMRRPAPPPPTIKLEPPRLLTLSLTPPPAAPPEAPRRVQPEPRLELPSEPPPRRREREDERSARDEAPPRPLRGPSAYAPTQTTAPTKRNPMLWVVAAAAGLVFAVGARMARDRDIARPAPPAPSAVGALEAPGAAAAPAEAEPRPAQEPSTDAEGDSARHPVPATDMLPKAEDKVRPGHGLLEITAGPNDVVSIDGKESGKGPLVKVALGAKPSYEVQVKQGDRVRVRYAAVRDGRVTRLRVSPPWAR